ncbi:MAG: hypothetical protein AB7P01_06800 [Bacteroidia bacterium]
MAENEATRPENDFKITEYLNYGGPFLIFLGMARLISFYQAFGVSIVSYLDFSEIITSFFDILVVVIFLFAYILIQNVILTDKNEADRAQKQRQELIIHEDNWKRLWLYFLYLKRLIIIGVVLILGCAISHFIFHKIEAFTIFIIAAFFVFLIIFSMTLVEIERKHNHFQSSINKRRFVLLTLYFMVFSMGVVYYSSYQAGLIKRDKSTYGVAITLDNDQMLISDSTDYYIGKTLNYVFIFHEKQKTTDIIPMSRVKQITITN